MVVAFFKFHMVIVKSHLNTGSFCFFANFIQFIRRFSVFIHDAPSCSQKLEQTICFIPNPCAHSMRLSRLSLNSPILKCELVHFNPESSIILRISVPTCGLKAQNLNRNNQAASTFPSLCIPKSAIFFMVPGKSLFNSSRIVQVWKPKFF